MEFRFSLRPLSTMLELRFLVSEAKRRDCFFENGLQINKLLDDKNYLQQNYLGTPDGGKKYPLPQSLKRIKSSLQGKNMTNGKQMMVGYF